MRVSFSAAFPFFLYVTSALGQVEVRVKNTVIAGSPVPELQQEFFGGIPFAEPPIGSLRFAPPKLKLDPAVDTLNATQYGPACAQALSGVGGDPTQINNTIQSEDCLTLNVVRPAGSNSTGSLPVMVWVYGGAFQNGASSWYPADLIVARSVSRGTPIIFVSLNYRLGPFGFPQGAEATARGALNLGHKDVLAALQWIQENIAAFGGDKDRVTVFGVSAGSILLNALLLDPDFSLARAAIFESGSAASIPLLEGSTSNTAWDILASSVPECAGSPNNTFNCLCSASTQAILNATESVYATYSQIAFSPVIDGPGGIIPTLPSKLHAGGRFSHIPFIAGTNLDEGTIFAPPTINATEQILYLFYADSDSLKKEIIELYPDDPSFGSPFGTGNETFGLSPVFKRAAAIAGDINFGALRRSLTRVASRSGTKVYAYLFSDPQVNNSLPYLGVYHGSEVFYVFGAPPNGPNSVALAETIIDYWVSFATSLDPNDGKGNATRPVWKEYTPSSQDILQLHSTNLTMIPDTYRKHQIEFLISHEKNLGH
ncbi:hypothetical protein ACEPAF_4328 [Sanghuangporus sanghuang]